MRLRRLYFVDDPKRLTRDRNGRAKNGGGLVLVYQIANEGDSKEVEAEFERLFKAQFPKGMPGATVADPLPRTDDPKGKDAAEGDLLPGLTAELRKIVSSTRDQPREKNPWYGVFIERGYFDENDLYTIRGAVDTKEQNAELQKLLVKLKDQAKWKSYFSDQEGKEQPVAVPTLAQIPMGEMLDRIRRVMPAYREFDGVRVVDAYYGDDAKLIFRVHAVGTVTPDMVGKLADMLLEHPVYRNRVVKPPAPKEPRAPRAGRRWVSRSWPGRCTRTIRWRTSASVWARSCWRTPRRARRTRRRRRRGWTWRCCTIRTSRRCGS